MHTAEKSQWCEPEMAKWMLHRAGKERVQWNPIRILGKALELNRAEPSVIDTYGQKEFRAYVGFIDIVGFSSTTKGKSPAEIKAYVKPFLDDIIRRLTAKSCLIDKTIGDEIMFILPDTQQERGFPLQLLIGHVMTEIKQHYACYRDTHPFRLGLAYGTVGVDQVGGNDFCEWTTFGEPIVLAKRVHGLSELSEPDGLVGAFGMLVRDAPHPDGFVGGLLSVTLCNTSWKIIRPPEVFDQLKGVSPARVAVIRAADLDGELTLQADSAGSHCSEP